MPQFETEDLQQIGETAEMVAECMRRIAGSIFDSTRELLNLGGQVFAQAESAWRRKKGQWNE